MPFLKSMFDECNLPYDWDHEEQGEFDPQWTALSSNKSGEELKPTPWTYQTQWTLKGTPYWGQFATYWGGGESTLRKSCENVCLISLLALLCSKERPTKPLLHL